MSNQGQEHEEEGATASQPLENTGSVVGIVRVVAATEEKAKVELLEVMVAVDGEIGNRKAAANHIAVALATCM
eukprot:g30769.t1